MRLLFMSPLALTLHETTMGLDLADQLVPAGVKSHFVVDAGNEAMLRSSRHAYTTVTSALGRRVEDVVAGVVRDFAPDAIVLCDYTAHWMTHVVSYDTDPWYVERFGVPVIPIDLYDLTRTGREVEILGRTMRVSDRILHMEAHLWPVPGVRPHAAPDGPAFPYRADPTVRPLSAAARQEVRDGLSVHARHRLLTVPTLPWQHLMQTRAGPLTRELARRVPHLVAGYLAKLPDDTRFLFLGPWFDGFDRLPRERVRHRPSCTAGEYTRLIGASDAVLALFLPSFALERAILADVPGLFTVNSHRLDPADAAGLPDGLTPDVRSWLSAFPGTVPPFHMWPLQWNRVVGPLLEDNPFTATAVRTELFDEEAVVSGLEAVLHDTATRDALAAGRAGFRRAVDLLPDTPDVFFAAARRVGLSG
ncbi:DUF6365 family protein [Streptomyces sp. NPDC059506]|uniref:DUF6365 family protein n=1 Tax=Streptomyces TaxID=1883 RepID=UPI000CBC3E18|nr:MULTISPECIES: DUF6365 family protein [unclassified Streptomyces]MCZ2526336.1 DUF6365 family protein [Streptomyces sp. HB2AG]PLW74052.1 hypothetical protein C0036_03985 [Streptomyces sp. DJ]QMV21217.1 hypothetical protein GQS52_04890 [Streptomyces sp. SCUT-3]